MIKSNRYYLQVLSGLSGVPSIIKCLRVISGLLLSSSQTDCLAAITGESKGKSKLWYYKVWAGVVGDVTINYCLRMLASFIPPQEANVLQWLDGTQTSIGNFDGATYLTITKEVVIDSTKRCYFDSKLTPTAPNTNEGLYNIGTLGFRYIYLDPSLNVRVNAGVLGEIVVGTLIEGLRQRLQIYASNTVIECYIDGVLASSTAVTLASGSVPSYTVGLLGAFYFTGRMEYFGDCDTTYYPDQTYPEVTLTDPNGTYRKYNLLPDKSENGNYGLYDNVPVVVDAVDSDRVVGNFDLTNYLTIPINQGITSEYQCFFRGTIKATPNEASTETIFSFLNAFLFIDSSGDLRMVDGSGVLKTFFTGVDTTVDHEISLSMKEGFSKMSLDWVEVEVLANFPVKTWNQVGIGYRISDTSRFYTGLMRDIYLCNDQSEIELFTLNDTLVGSLGTVAVLVDPNGTFWDKGIANLINIDPNGTLDTALGLTAGTLNFFATREYLATVYDRLKIWTPLNDGEKYLSVIYNAIVAEEADKIKLDKYVRRSL